MDALRLQDINNLYRDIAHRENHKHHLPQNNCIHTTQPVRDSYFETQVNEPIPCHSCGEDTNRLFYYLPQYTCLNCYGRQSTTEDVQYDQYIDELMEETRRQHDQCRGNEEVSYRNDKIWNMGGAQEQDDTIFDRAYQSECRHDYDTKSSGSSSNIYSSTHIRQIQARAEHNNRDTANASHSLPTQQHKIHRHGRRR
jgi:hypothetical protein